MPNPTTTGGGLMSYPTTVDSGGVSPLILNTPGIENGVSSVAVVAGSAYASLVQVLYPVTIAQMRCHFPGASPTGSIDMGIYDSSGTNGGPNNLIGHTGNNAASTGMFTKSITGGNFTLSPGNYWLAFLDTVADNVSCRQPNATGMGPMVKTTATNLTVLGSTFGALADINFLVAVYALVSGGYS